MDFSEGRLYSCVWKMQKKESPNFFSISNNYTNRSVMLSSDRLCPNTDRRPIGRGGGGGGGGGGEEKEEEEEEEGEEG